MRYWEACEAQVTAAEAIAECTRHQIVAGMRETDAALIDQESGDVIAHVDEHGEYYGGDISRLSRRLIDGCTPLREDRYRDRRRPELGFVRGGE